MAEFHFPPYCNDDFALLSDATMSAILKEMIDEVMIENHLYYDNDDRAEAIEVIYPTVASIVFNPHCSHLRNNTERLVDFITDLVTHLS